MICTFQDAKAQPFVFLRAASLEMWKLFQDPTLGWTLSLPLHYQWLSDGTTKYTNVHDDGLSPSVMKGLARHRGKAFFSSACLRGNFLSRQRQYQLPGCLFLRLADLEFFPIALVQIVITTHPGNVATRSLLICRVL